MQLTLNLENEGFSLGDISDSDWNDFIHVEKVSHYIYVAEHSDFFGEWNEQILRSAFVLKSEMPFFKKLLLNGETVGFLSYDHHADSIDNVYIRIVPEIQSRGIGTWFLMNLIELSKENFVPIYLTAIKTNPAQNLYKRMGFKVYEEKDVFFFFRYN